MIESLFKNLAQLGAQIEQSQDRHREEFKAKEPRKISDLRCCLDGTMAFIYNEANEPIENITDVIEYQLSVSASFIKTHFLLNTLILEGALIESFILLRKQLESLARLEELNKKPLQKLEGQTPKIQNAINGHAGRIYGALSEVAHFSCFKVNSLLSVVPRSKHAEVTVFSTYSENALNCMKLRLYLGLDFIRWMTTNLKAWYPQKNWHSLEDRLKLVFAMALDSGVIEQTTMPK